MAQCLYHNMITKALMICTRGAQGVHRYRDGWTPRAGPHLEVDQPPWAVQSRPRTDLLKEMQRCLCIYLLGAQGAQNMKYLFYKTGPDYYLQRVIWQKSRTVWAQSGLGI